MADFAYGRRATHAKAHAAMQQDKEPPNKRLTPFPIMVANGTFTSYPANWWLLKRGIKEAM